MKIRNKTYTRLSPIPDWIYEQAEARASMQPVLDYSHRKEDANNIGCLGEVIAEHWMTQNNITFSPDLEKTTHDYKINGNLTVDIKTKDRTVVPKIDYDNSTPLYNHDHQNPDYFLFISLHRSREIKNGTVRDFHSAYLVGSISYEELDRIGIKFKKDEVDWRNGTKFWTDCLNVQMSQLVSLKETKAIFKGELSAPSQLAEIDTGLIRELTERRSARLQNVPV